MADKPNTTNPSDEPLDGPFTTLGELIAATNVGTFTAYAERSEIRQMGALLRRCDAEALARGLSPEAARKEGLKAFIKLLEAEGPS